MTETNNKLKTWTNLPDKGVSFFCPGCNEVHTIRTEGAGAPWTWNGSMEAPTFHPSVLITGGHYIEGDRGGCWCKYNEEHPDKPSPFKCQRCHSFVKDGMIQFLGDCSHELVNQTVPLPDYPTD